jgi:hypothetical protein
MHDHPPHSPNNLIITEKLIQLNNITMLTGSRALCGKGLEVNVSV